MSYRSWSAIFCVIVYWKTARNLRHVGKSVAQNWRLLLDETVSIWNQYEIGTEKPCVYTGPDRSALNRFFYPVPNEFICENDPSSELCRSRVVRCPCEPNTTQANLCQIGSDLNGTKPHWSRVNAAYQAIPGNDQNVSPTHQKTAGSKLDRAS